MKTTIEVNGYTIVIEDIDGNVNVSAIKDDETIEEFTLESGSFEGQDEEEGEVQGFDEFSGEEEEDFEGEDLEEMEDDEDEMEEDEDEDEDEGQLESFNKFIKRK